MPLYVKTCDLSWVQPRFVEIWLLICCLSIECPADYTLQTSDSLAHDADRHGIP